MRRSAEGRLKKWLKNPYRKPLVVRGARQVGKSTLVRTFAKQQGLVLHEVNLERHLELSDLLGTQDITEILRELEFICGKGPINKEDSLLFLDEIQAVPIALQTLRYLYEDYPKLPVIAAGSLLEFALAEHSFSMPVGRIEYLHLGPASLEEYIEELDEQNLLELMRDYSPRERFPRAAHKRLLELQRDFFLVGGMPEATQRYVDTRDLDLAFEVQTSIVETFRDDFSKYSIRAKLRTIQKVFDYVPQSVGEKFKYVNVDSHTVSREIRAAVDLLAKAGVITLVFHSDSTGVPLRATQDERIFKAYFLDCGLMNRMCGAGRICISDLSDYRFINEGKIAEQFIAQHLLFIGKTTDRPSLNYWLREKRRGNAEVDFVIQAGTRIIPIEVKSGKSGTLKSVQQFVLQKGIPFAVRFDLNPPSFQHVSHHAKYHSKNLKAEFDLLSLPLYMVEQVPRLVQVC